MGTDNMQFCLRFRVWRRKVRERNSDFSLRSTELGWLSCFVPRLEVGELDEGYEWKSETPSFTKVSRRRFGESKALGSSSVWGLPWVVAYASRGREPSYSGLFSI